MQLLQSTDDTIVQCSYKINVRKVINIEFGEKG